MRDRGVWRVARVVCLCNRSWNSLCEGTTTLLLWKFAARRSGLALALAAPATAPLLALRHYLRSTRDELFFDVVSDVVVASAAAGALTLGIGELWTGALLVFLAAVMPPLAPVAALGAVSSLADVDASLWLAVALLAFRVANVGVSRGTIVDVAVVAALRFAPVWL